MSPAGHSQNAPTAKLVRPQGVPSTRVAARQVEILLGRPPATIVAALGTDLGLASMEGRPSFEPFGKVDPFSQSSQQLLEGAWRRPLDPDDILLLARARLRSWGRQGAQGANSGQLRTAAVSQTPPPNRRADLIRLTQINIRPAQRRRAAAWNRTWREWHSRSGRRRPATELDADFGGLFCVGALRTRFWSSRGAAMRPGPPKSS
jgi:hypothetical protein